MCCTGARSPWQKCRGNPAGSGLSHCLAMLCHSPLGPMGGHIPSLRSGGSRRDGGGFSGCEGWGRPRQRARGHLPSVAGAALTVGEAIPGRSSPSLLLCLGAPGADNDSPLFHVDVNAWELLRDWQLENESSQKPVLLSPGRAEHLGGASQAQGARVIINARCTFTLVPENTSLHLQTAHTLSSCGSNTRGSALPRAKCWRLQQQTQAA